MKPRAVHTTASPMTDSITCAEGIEPGQRNAASGAYTMAVRTSEATTTASGGAPESERAKMIGPIA